MENEFPRRLEPAGFSDFTARLKAAPSRKMSIDHMVSDQFISGTIDPQFTTLL